MNDEVLHVRSHISEELNGSRSEAAIVQQRSH